jgi:hypothetical protein
LSRDVKFFEPLRADWAKNPLFCRARLYNERILSDYGAGYERD